MSHLTSIKKNWKFATLHWVFIEIGLLGRFIVLPYAQSNFEDFEIRLKHLVNKKIPQVDFNVAYQKPKTICYSFCYSTC